MSQSIDSFCCSTELCKRCNSQATTVCVYRYLQPFTGAGIHKMSVAKDQLDKIQNINQWRQADGLLAMKYIFRGKYLIESA